MISTKPSGGTSTGSAGSRGILPIPPRSMPAPSVGPSANRESTSLRLLRYLRPYRGRLIVTALLMVGFALSSGITIGMISPFVKVLFTPHPATSTPNDPRGGSSAATDAVIGAVTGGNSPSGTPAGSGVAARVSSWKQSLRTWFEHFFLTGDPLRSLTRICFALLVVFLIKNVFDFLTNVL